MPERRLDSNGGQFPMNHLRVLHDLDSQLLLNSNEPHRDFYIATATFKFETDGDLDFQKGII